MNPSPNRSMPVRTRFVSAARISEQISTDTPELLKRSSKRTMHQSRTGKTAQAQSLSDFEGRRSHKNRKMGGLSLPDVVRELIKDHSVLRWCSNEFEYEVIDGQKFESR